MSDTEIRRDFSKPAEEDTNLIVLLMTRHFKDAVKIVRQLWMTKKVKGICHFIVNKEDKF